MDDDPIDMTKLIGISRRVFYVDVGRMSKRKAERVLRDMVQRWKSGKV